MQNRRPTRGAAVSLAGGWPVVCGRLTAVLFKENSNKITLYEYGFPSTAMEPEMRVIRTLKTGRFCRRTYVSITPVVTAAKVFFEPDIGTDEKVTAAHFLDLELGHAVSAVLPRYRC